MLASGGEYPLRRPYFPRFGATRAPRGFNRWKPFPAHRRSWNENPCLRGNIVRAVSDDDTNYTILGLIMVERHGHDLTTGYVGRMWHETLPYSHVCTAEHVAYANLVRGIEPPHTATYRNPFRQWIGAQIRCDAFGYCANGNAARAAAWAHTDAALSHTRNGIYGEMFFAALIAACTALSEIDGALDIALAEIPPKSRFAEMVRWMRELREDERDWEAARDRIEDRYGHLHVVHTINNAAVVLLGLLWGESNFHKTVSRAVLAGWDTDCNGATAGSVFGALHGEAAIPAGYVRPLHDTLASSLAGFSEGSIFDYAERSLRAARSMERRMRSKGQ
jgi:ADP-ribosylglycohydrolase